VYTGPGSRLDPAANKTVNPGQSITVPGRIQYLSSSYLNLAQQKVRYLDLQLSYDKTTDTLGRFRFSTTWTYLDYYGFVSTAGNPMFDYTGTDGYPKWRGQTVLAWNRNEWAASLISNFADKYAKIAVDGFDVARHYTFGASVSYDLPIMDNATVTLYVDNILDRDPPLYYDGIGYDGSMISRPQGRFYYITLKKGF